MVNAQPCTMGGIIDYGVGFATRSSSCNQAIEKAQEELRKKRHVREQRMRELEFLEKGGNPLDFEFSHVATASGVPSTSLTNQRAKQNVMSEAKSRFAASPHGDSIESNHRPGSSLCHKTNTADGGGKSDIVGDKVVERGTKRLNAVQPKKSLSTDSSNKSARKTQDCGLSRLVVTSHAYVRRNRSRPSRESANVFSIRSSVTPDKGSEPRDENGVAQSKIADEPDYCVKPTGSYSENAPKDTASDDRVAMELDGFQNIRESDCVVKNESKAEEVASVETPGANPNVFMRQCDSSASTCDERETCAGDVKADDSNLDTCVGNIHVGELDKKRVDPACALEDPGIHKNAVDPPCAGSKITVDDHLSVDINLVATKVDGKSHDDLNNSRCSNKTLKKSGQAERFIEPTSMEVNMDHVQPESSDAYVVKDVVEFCDHAIVAKKDARCTSSGRSMNIEGSPASDRKNDNCLSDPISARPTALGTDLPKNYVPDAVPSLKSDEPNMESDIKKSENLDKMSAKAYEDSILRNARAIKANIRRAGERLLCNTSLEKRRKGHWDFVLEEMAWMANDFMQERLWKSVAAAQMCCLIASDGRAKFEEASVERKQKTIMKSLTKSIMSFWRSAEASQTARRTALMQEHNSSMLEETKASGIKGDKEQGNKSQGAGESLQPQQSQIQDYAVRFLEYNCRAADSLVLAEAPPTPDRMNDFGILKVSDQLSEESLFYTVAAGAMMAYRESVKSEYNKRRGNTELMDEYEASVCDSAADFPREDTYDEDEGASEAYEGGFLSKMCNKKKHQMNERISGARQYVIGTYVPYEPCLESKPGNRRLLSNGKRSSFLAVPAKRSRTAARQRVVSSFHASATGARHATSKTDASSGDTNSIQDDESSLHGGSLQWRDMDYESTVDFDRKLPYDAGEVSTKANKKKKLNNPGYKTAQNTANSFAPASVKNHMYDRRLQVEDYLKKRPESHQYNSNGIYGANGVQHASKKLKMMKQGVNNSPEASRVASQMSNMVNPAGFVKIIANRERGRKCKALKMTSSDGWSSFEDQALVVLVHDMGQNWGLICDAINNIVKFKSVHRQPKECKERHKILMDRSSGDGADSADSGSSQHYHNSLPGIPKGSARQLFERLQGPFEEENLKEHFEKIILLMQQVHSRHRQGNSQELKPIMQPHSSHVIVRSQICVNKLPESCLTPLDLCDPVSPNLDSVTPGLSLGSHTNALTLPNHQSSAGPATPTSNPSSRLPGAPGMVLGNDLPSSSSWNSHRDAQKYGVPRHGDEQPKTQYNQAVSSRNFQQSGGSVPGVFPTGIDHSARTIPGAQMAGLNRGVPVAKAGIPRISAPGGPAVSPGNLVPNSGQTAPGPVNFHPGGISGSENSISRPRDPAQIHHPGYSIEEHKQVPDMHMQVPQGSSHTANINPSFSNISASPPFRQPQQTKKMSQSSHMFGNPDHSQIQKASASQQQREYALHLPKEMHQQHMVSQQNSDISGASAVSYVQSGSGSHIMERNQCAAVNPVPCLQPQHQRQQAPQNPPDASSSPNLPATATLQKQKKQQGQQQSRQNLHERNQVSKQAKLMKSLGQGHMVIPQTPPADDMPANAVWTPSEKHIPDKKQMQHGQEFPPANKVLPPSMLQPINQPKLYTMLSPSQRQLPDIGNNSRMQISSTQTQSDSRQPPVQSKSTLTTQQQQTQNTPSPSGIQRTTMQQNCQISECRTDSHPKQVQRIQMVPATSIPLSTDSGSPLLSPKCEASHNPASVNSSSNLLNTPSNTSFGNETVLPSSGQDVLQRQFSGGFPTQSQVAGQWNQQARQQPQSQHQQAPIVQGTVYAPSNSGSG